MSANRALGADILLVDDQLANLQLLECILQAGGHHRITSCSDPLAAQALLRSTLPDVAILDLHMPALDGLALTRLIRSRAQAGGVPVIILTADSSEGARQAALEAGAVLVLHKPASPARLLRELERLLPGDASPMPQRHSIGVTP